MKALQSEACRAGEGTERFLTFLGLCRRAGKTVHGTPLVCAALAAKRPPFLVLMSEEASDGTKKRLCNKTSFYRVSLLSLPVSCERLAKAVGKTGCLAAVAVTDEGFARELAKIYAKGKDSSTEEDR